MEIEKQFKVRILGNIKELVSEGARIGQRHGEKTCSCQGGWWWGGMDWEFGMSRCKLLYIGCINNMVLLYSTGNYIKYPVINHNRKEF